MKFVLVALLCFGLSACTATVPKEVVELSYQMEKDLVGVEKTYITLVKQHVSVLKKQREDYLNNEWVPAMLEDWITEGKLVPMAKGEVIYDDLSGDFITTPSPNRRAQLRSIVEWSHAAVEAIESKRRELIQPLEEAESSLIEDIERSFDLLHLGNQTISAHLNSIREVQDVQNELLEKAGWDGLRSDINQKLSDLSVKASEGLDEVRKLDSKTKDKLEKLK
ncbi:hypothetical protein [Photobacterium sp. TY1-4]|uniref:hypothetical protein n=1 Tax=Photobacterium sp. TY1-4 TaxID=2899122 RepID=UPI0021BE8485|nr:hypothetical protein [Photobacterium sp. TY1-4]UXI04659.1 hypothetical protein NH461_25425 [Photobacterium sp. TY1-4]